MFERLMFLAKSKGYKGIPELAISLGYSSPEKLYRLKKEGSKPSIDIINDLSNLFEDLNLKWFLNGIGEPFLKYDILGSNLGSNVGSNLPMLEKTMNILSEPMGAYKSSNTILYDKLIEEKDNRITALTEVIEAQRETISLLKGGYTSNKHKTG